MSPGRSVRHAVLTCCFAALQSARPAIASEPAPPPGERPHVVLSVSGGLVRPADAGVRELYGETRTVFGLDCEVTVRGPLDLFLGVRFAGVRGSTLVVPPQAFAESHEIELTTRHVHIGAALTTATRARLRWTAGAGLAIGTYEERWPALGDPVRGTSAGLVALGGAHYDLGTRVGLVARVEWSPLRADRAADGRRPNLGGVGVSAGASARF